MGVPAKNQGSSAETYLYLVLILLVTKLTSLLLISAQKTLANLTHHFKRWRVKKRSSALRMEIEVFFQNGGEEVFCAWWA